MGKSLPHPVGVFCTIPNPPKCHIMQKSFFFGKTVIFNNIHIISLFSSCNPWRLIGTHLKTPKLDDKKNSLHFSIFAKKMTSQKYGQIVPTPRGSILPHTKPSQVPYNAKIVLFRENGNIQY